MEPVKWNMACHIMLKDLLGDLFVPGFWFEREMYEETGGLITIDAKSGLFDWAEDLYALSDGRVPIAAVAYNYNFGDNPLWSLPVLPGLYKNGAQFMASWLYDEGIRKTMQGNFDHLGVKIIGVMSTPPQILWVTGDPIVTLDDFVGVKIRTSSVKQGQAVEVLGGTALTIPGGEMFTAMETGVIDAAVTGIGGGISTGITDLASSVIWWPIQVVQPQIIAVNQKAFDALPRDVQDAVIQVGRRTTSMLIYGGDVDWIGGKGVLNGMGVEYLKPSDAELDKAVLKLGTLHGEWFAETGDEGRRQFDIVKAWVDRDNAERWVYESGG
jgi:hypothetical protein